MMQKVEPNNNPEERRRRFTGWLQRLKQEISEYLPLLRETMGELYVTKKKQILYGMLLTPAVILTINGPKMLRNFT
jgi:hypothetical protein